MTSQISSFQSSSQLPNAEAQSPTSGSEVENNSSARIGELSVLIGTEEQPKDTRSWCAKHKWAIMTAAVLCTGGAACGALIPLFIYIAQIVNMRRNGF